MLTPGPPGRLRCSGHHPHFTKGETEVEKEVICPGSSTAWGQTQAWWTPVLITSTSTPAERALKQATSGVLNLFFILTEILGGKPTMLRRWGEDECLP